MSRKQRVFSAQFRLDAVMDLLTSNKAPNKKSKRSSAQKMRRRMCAS